MTLAHVAWRALAEELVTCVSLRKAANLVKAQTEWLQQTSIKDKSCNFVTTKPVIFLH